MKTALYHLHVALGAKIIPFSGWEMPLQYEGILAEHRAVREAVGLFDVSHMGRIEVSGPDSERFLDYLSVNQITEKLPGSATYTVFCDEGGRSVEDTVVFQIDPGHFFLVANAGNRSKVLSHLENQAKRTGSDVQITPLFDGYGILALQGPGALPLLSSFYPEAGHLKPMQFMTIRSERLGCFISRTGYTGSGGFEIYGPDQFIHDMWVELMRKGEDSAIKPIGLGARDSLRLEMGFALYGHELSETISPAESVSRWTIKREKPLFLGKNALEESERKNDIRHACGIRLIDPAIPRQGCRVFSGQKVIGEITSGGFSPILNAGIALALLENPLAVGDKVRVQIRNHLYSAEIAQLPFIRKIM